MPVTHLHCVALQKNESFHIHSGERLILAIVLLNNTNLPVGLSIGSSVQSVRFELLSMQCGVMPAFVWLIILETRSFQLIEPALHTLKCEYNEYAICCVFRHFLIAIIRVSLYRLKLCPSKWSVMCCTVTY